jgi:predicted enzyme related to lactoylglutathione lyase
MMKMAIFALLVKEYDEALEFYANKLGFIVSEDVTMGLDRWLTLTLPDNPECVIAFHKAQSEADIALVGRQTGSFPLFGIHTDDCLAAYEAMKARGVTFLGEPDVLPYGIGVMLEDLYGNQIYMNQEIAG